MLCTVIHKVAGWREREKCREMWSFLSATKILAIFGDCDKVIYYSPLTEKEENVCKPFFKKKKKVEIMCQWNFISNQPSTLVGTNGDRVPHVLCLVFSWFAEKKLLNIKLYFLDDAPTRGLPYMMCVADFS